jgi:hypothetical protein
MVFGAIVAQCKELNLAVDLTTSDDGGAVVKRHWSLTSEHRAREFGVSPIQISRCVGLGVNAYLDFLTSAILTPKSNIADEALPTDPLTLKQQGEWVTCDPPAFTRQSQKRITLVDSLPDTPRFQ